MSVCERVYFKKRSLLVLSEFGAVECSDKVLRRARRDGLHSLRSRSAASGAEPWIVPTRHNAREQVSRTLLHTNTRAACVSSCTHLAPISHRCCEHSPRGPVGLNTSPQCARCSPLFIHHRLRSVLPSRGPASAPRTSNHLAPPCTARQRFHVYDCDSGRTACAPTVEYDAAAWVYRHLRLATRTYMCGLCCRAAAERREVALRALPSSPLGCPGHTLAGTGGALCVSLSPY